MVGNNTCYARLSRFNALPSRDGEGAVPYSFGSAPDTKVEVHCGA
jgi:hypothetical protein